MSLNKKEKTELLKVYDTWWDSYLNGEVKTYDKYLADDYHFVGSTGNEEFLNRRDATQFFAETAGQLAGKAELRNVKRTIEPLDKLVLITDLADAYILSDGKWVFSSKFRFSSLLRKDKDGWKFIYQHFSAPDTKAQEGETLGLEKITNENFELRDAIKRHTAELQQKNRELEIEAALERVRARAMAMHKSDELSNVARLLFKQVNDLGIKTWTTGFNVWSEDNRYYKDYITSPKGDFIKPYLVDTSKSSVLEEVSEVRKRGDAFFEQLVEGKALREMYIELITFGDQKKYDKMLEEGFEFPTSQVHHFVFGLKVSLMFVTFKPMPEAHDIFKRFGKVFQQAYTRFLDLQKAEEQAKEAQIETALEKVRSRSLAMHKSDEVGEVANILMNKLQELNATIDNEVMIMIHTNDSSRNSVMWLASPDLYSSALPFNVPYVNLPMASTLWDAFDSGKKYFTKIFSHKVKNEWFKWAFEHSDFKLLPEERKQDVLESKDYSLSIAFEKHTSILIPCHTGKVLREDQIEILKRFAKVFEQAYTRFLDLQKAEEQAREAQIEVALERVRSRSMAMHNTSELWDVINVVFKQFESLEIPLDTCFFNIFQGNSRDWNMWIAASGQTYASQTLVPFISHPAFNRLVKARKNGETFYSQNLNRKLKDRFFDNFFKKAANIKVPQNRKKLISQGTGMYQAVTLSKYASIHLVNYQSISYSEEELQIFQRIGKVFEQSYSRFLDLQKAEKQAREAQIEASLERVRSKTMAMHNSKDVELAVITLFDEILRLGIDKSIRCGIGILKGNEGMETWSVTSNSNGEVDLKMGMLNMTIHPFLIKMKKAWKKGETGFTYKLKGNDVTRYYKALNDDPGYPFNAKLDTLPENEFINTFFFSEGILFAFAPNPISEEAAKVLKRFTSVFEQTYTRFLDLQKAEAQVREAQIEAALERVRTASMGMHISDDVAKATRILFHELDGLEITNLRCGILIINQNKTMDLWTASSQSNNKVVSISGNIDMTIHPLFQQLYVAWKVKKKKFTYELKGKDAEKYYKAIQKSSNYKLPDNHIITTSHFCKGFLFNEGALFAFMRENISEEDARVYNKFANVFSLTYRRYLDLKEAEEREKEAIKQSSLDRVRAEIASMRTADDLNRITPLVWQELTTLGVPFFRCGVFIMDDENQKVHAYLSTPSGESRAVLHLDYKFELGLIKSAITHWKKQKIYTEEWNRKQFVASTKLLLEQGQVESASTYLQNEKPPARLVLQLIPFAQGMLYIGSADPLVPEQMDLAVSLTKAFAVAYSRYEDFRQLEIAKKTMEDALNELKTTQSQLIQSEKMASLGELTAGIAHEIQNPLNFVNNFSELSEEMLEELAEEIPNNSDEIVTEIMTDLKQNLNKITTHGKRASNIVKGMLEHSRTSIGVKEHTDVNALADEFLRLSYHGLRAKDKTFNASFKTEFDTSLPKIEVIVQDLGRVILNLINNAFYAVSERAKASQSTKGGAKYKPKVTVSTKAYKSPSGDLGVEIRVIDNGSGIPKEIKEKIFQPFFTTKPTGSGTGLGLSLAYDIITKGHGGELTVASEKGKGSIFTIQLINNLKG